MDRPERRGFVGLAAAAVAGCVCGRLPAQGPVGKMRTLASFPTLKQPDDISCGPTSAAMVLRWYGIIAGIDRCIARAGTRWLELGAFKLGMTLPSGVAGCLSSFGVPSRIVSGSNDDLVRFIDQGRPPILLVRSGASTWHWLVAIGYFDGGARLRLSDPAGMQWTIARSTLDAAWTFTADLKGNAAGSQRCGPCRGTGKKGVPAGKCLACDGTGKAPDFCRQVVEACQVAGHTLVVPDRGRPAARP